VVRFAAPLPTSRGELCRSLGATLTSSAQAQDGPQLVGVPALRVRQVQVDSFLASEERYLRRQSFAMQFSLPASWLMVVLKGRVVVELNDRQTQYVLDGLGSNVCVTQALTQEMVVLQAPVQLVRLRIHPSMRWQPNDFCGQTDFSLLLPTLQLLQQAHHDAAPDQTRLRLAEALQSYCTSQLEPCGVVLVPAFDDPLEVLLIWLQGHLQEAVVLADLASAVRLSPRRLQELTQERFGLSPMELLRQHRLEAFHDELLDPAHRHLSVAALMKRSHLANSASTRLAFEALYGKSPMALRKGLESQGRSRWSLNLLGGNG